MFERTKNLRLSIIKQIELKASQYPNSISLAQGIPGFDTPGGIKRRVELALKNKAVAKYSLSPGLSELRELIALELEKENIFVDWEKEIIVTAGTIEAISASIMALTSPGDEILIPEPTYTSYREVITLSGCKAIFVPLNERKGWAFELDKYERAITEKTKAIFYCNPNNPTGTIYSKKDLLGLAKLAQKHNLYLISDEVYKDFIFDEKEKIFSLAEIPELRKRLIRIYGFSKAYSMTGWRIGYLHSDSSIVYEILKVHDCLVTCAPVVSQYAAMGALEMGAEAVKEFNKKYGTLRDLACKRLDNLSHIFDYIKPQSTYYIFPKIKKNSLAKLDQQGRIDCWDFVNRVLEKIQVAMVPGSAFGPNGRGHVRINFGRSRKDLEKAFDRLDKLFQKQ
ncbi:MAG: aminotransferase class I/II-fold pyridoxal phosphate-dependent enzyme [Candidatus Moranbacteria bacterium]|nr:aminotransferase class I/II-fold pyridoxal phosphate-dependent enzyme [Candidatus Moranbacteria bacterium]